MRSAAGASRRGRALRNPRTIVGAAAATTVGLLGWLAVTVVAPAPEPRPDVVVTDEDPPPEPSERPSVDRAVEEPEPEPDATPTTEAPPPPDEAPEEPPPPPPPIPDPADPRLPEWAARPERVVDVPAGIDRSGGRDVADDLNRFLASVPDDSVVRFPEGARYRAEERVVLAGRRNVVVDGNGATIFATTPGAGTRSHLRIEAASNVVVRDLVVRGAHRDGGADGTFDRNREHQHGIDVRNSDRVAIVGVTVTDVFGDFVYLGRIDTKVPWTSNVVVRDSTFARNGRQGVALTAARHVLIERNRFDDMRRATFDLEPGGADHGVEHVTIRDNDIGRGRLLFIAAAGKGPVDHISIVGNRLRGQAMQIQVNDTEGRLRRGWRVLENHSDLPFGAPHGAAMRFTRVDGIEVRGNHQPFKPGREMFGVSTERSCNLRLGGNVYPHAVGQSRSEGDC